MQLRLEAGCRTRYDPSMSRIEEIEAEIAKLPPQDARRIAEWLETFLSDLRDRQLAEDAKAGRLDPLTRQALREIEAGETQPLDEFLRHP